MLNGFDNKASYLRQSLSACVCSKALALDELWPGTALPGWLASVLQR